jgi:hypothetical protein
VNLKKVLKVDLKLVKLHYQKHHHSSHENKLCPCKGEKIKDLWWHNNILIHFLELQIYKEANKKHKVILYMKLDAHGTL